MPFIRCATPAETATAWDREVAAQGTAAFLVFGSESPETGASWCQDCVVADPVLRAAIAKHQPGLRVYECPVGKRSAWKGNDQHPYRRHPGLRVARIPTLVLMIDGIERGRLVEGDCASPTAVAAFVGA